MRRAALNSKAEDMTAEREMKKKSKAQDFFKVGAQINTLLKLEDNQDDRTTTYSFFGISYTSKDSKESNLDTLELEEYSENTKYFGIALLLILWVPLYIQVSLVVLL